MNNLKLYSEVSLNLELQSNEENLLFSAFDLERNRLFFISSTNSIYVSHLSSFQNGNIERGSSLCGFIDLEDEDFVTAFDYLMEKEALLLGTSNGLLLLHNIDDNVTEEVGRLEGGVKCIMPSPDGDLLAVVTGFRQLLVMTHDWDLLYETALEEDQADGVDVSDLTSNATFESSISWRGDGKYFATLSEVRNASSSNKKLKVWERDSGALHAASDSNVFVGTILDWMPSGAKIAAVHDKKTGNRYPAVVFYERNGLLRSSFSINEPIDAVVKSLKWNCNSELLGSIVQCSTYDSVRIWYFSNNYWYLKHEIRYSRQDAVKFMWDPVRPFQLVCWSVWGQITVYNFVWITAVMDNSMSLVVDDSKILVTPLALSLMPPPLYLFGLKFPSAVRDINLYSKNSKNCIAAFLSDGCLSIVELPEPDTWEELEDKEFKVEALISETIFTSFTHLLWLDSHILLSVSSCGSARDSSMSHGLSGGGESHGLYLEEIELICSENKVSGSVTASGWHAKVYQRNHLEGRVIGLAPNPAKKSSAFVQLDGGKIINYESKVGLSSIGAGKSEDISFPSTCPWMSAALVESSGQSMPLLFGLDDIGRLHVNGYILCTNCSSFSFYSNLADQVVTHLILATKQDLLYIVDARDLMQRDVELKPENFIHSGSRRREEENINFISIWERGAKIIGVLDGDNASVIMQTTRGNLECIYPRKLVLASVVNALHQRRFRDALDMVRRHRIDFNVIVDYSGWQRFIDSATEFVRQVCNLNHITEFVCGIKKENIMETLYKNYISLPCPAGADDVQGKGFMGADPNKVSSVLLAIRKALEEHVPESPARELCILTTLARSDPPALAEALERIKVIRELEILNSSDPKRISYPSAEEALKHLLWLSDSDAVFEAALGLYDLNLAAIVALNSQRDPKEFLPYLQELERMPTLIMRYNIDLRLQRFQNALKHIVAAGEAYFSDCMNLLIKNPQLFPLGLQLITDPPKRMQVLDAWGDHLSNEKCFEDAATTYLCCNSLEKALKAYRASGNWSGVLTVAGLLKLAKDEVMQLAHDLCEELQALGKPGEAARIALDYCGDINNGISLLISARDFEEALRIAFMHMREDLILEVRSASLECASTLIGDYEEGVEKVGKYLTRYLAVRQRRLLLAAKLQAEERSVNDLDDDTASETSSNFSGMSAYTTGSTKVSSASVRSSITSKARNARRQRSRGKIRPGSPGEELALVEHLKSMSLTAGAKRELKSLLVCLVMLGAEEIARKLQRTGENFQLSHMAAVKLSEDTLDNDVINEQDHTLESYIKKVKSEPQYLEALSWRSKVFLSPNTLM